MDCGLWGRHLAALPGRCLRGRQECLPHRIVAYSPFPPAISRTKFDDAVDLHLIEHPGAVFGDRLLADAQFGGDLLGVSCRPPADRALRAGARRAFRCGPPVRPSAPLTPRTGVAVDGLLNPRQHRPPVERLFQKVQRAAAHGLHGHGDVGAAGDHDDRYFPVLGGEHLLKSQPAQARHAHVEHHALRGAGRVVIAVEKRLGGRVRLGVQAHAADHQTQGLADLRIVVHDIHGWRCCYHIVTSWVSLILARGAMPPGNSGHDANL